MHTQQRIAGEKIRMFTEDIEFSIEKSSSGWSKIITNLESECRCVLEYDQEFSISIHTDAGEEMRYSEADCQLISFENSNPNIAIVFQENNGLFELRVQYEIVYNKYVKKRFTIKPLHSALFLKEIVLDHFDYSGYTERGGEGQPIFLDGNWFMGVEFPVSLNEAIDGTLSFKHRPGIQVQHMQTWQSYNLVIGFNDCEGLEQSFLSYMQHYQIRKEPKQISIYCDWGLHDELSDQIELTEQMTDEMLDHLSWMKETHSLSFDYYLIDAFWFEDNARYLSFKSTTWPSGFEKIKRKMDGLNLRLGLWFDLSAHFLRMEDVTEARIDKDQYALCLGHPDYLELLRNALIYHVREHGMKMIKFDFAVFACSNPDHGHLTGDSSKEYLISRFIEMLQEVRREEPELIVLAYNGFTIHSDWIKDVDSTKEGSAVSPWWTAYLDFIYCGDPRPSEIPTLRLRDSIHYYTDAMIKQFREALLPYETVDDHGVMIGDTGTIYRLGKEGWRNDWILSLSRGNRKSHFYGDIRLLDESDYVFLKQTWRLMEQAISKRFATKSIIGNPLHEEVYGYHNGNDEEGYLTLVNPYPKMAIIEPASKGWNRWGEEIDSVVLTKLYENEQWLDRDKHQTIVDASKSIELAPYAVTMLRWDKRKLEEQSELEWRTEELISLTGLEENSLLEIRDLEPLAEGSYMVVKYKDHNLKPLRTIHGLPDGVTLDLTVNGAGRSLLPQFDSDIWSGISWMIYRVPEQWDEKDQAVLTIKFTATQPIYIQLEKWIRKGSEQV